MIEVSSKNTHTLGMIDDINDVFSICALNCFDMSIDKQKTKLGISKKPNPSVMDKSGETFYYGGAAGIVGARAKVLSQFNFENDVDLQRPMSNSYRGSI